MVRIQDIEGMQYSRDGTKSEQSDYAFFNQQYATSTHQKDHNMFPDLIIQPKGDEDVIKAVNWARDNRVAIAVKSGGHQYSGASSTGGKNIQLDLTNTFKDMMVLQPVQPVEPDRALVYVGVSNRLMDFNAYLRHNGLFVPHGQCAYVCVGGHAQTGGYGQLGRSFGLFGDHIRTIRLVCHDGVIRDITKDTDPSLFYAILGGSPGNFGVITHYIVEVYQASSYVGTVEGPHGIKGPYGIRGLWIYSKPTLEKLLTNIAEMAENPEFPRGFDFCVSVLSTAFPIKYLFPELKDASTWEKIKNKIKNFLADEVLDLLNGDFPASIVVYAQWCPTSKTDKYDNDVDQWFQKFRDLNNVENKALTVTSLTEDMSKMTGEWIFPKEREFDMPYIKRAYSTSSRTLTKDKWPSIAASQIDQIYNPKQHLDHDSDTHEAKLYDLCKLSVQIQCFGGNQSRYFANQDDGTSYSWRDTTIVQVLDAFHEPTAEARKHADEWQKSNDKVMVGPKGVFSKQDRRLLWGSYGDWDLSKEEVWKLYYEDKEKYQKLGATRARVDPHGTFTANPFAVTPVFTPN